MNSSNDRKVLLELFRATNGPSWRIKDGWDTNASISSWFGVTTDGDGRIVRLDLSDNKLKGEASILLGVNDGNSSRFCKLLCVCIKRYIKATIPPSLQLGRATLAVGFSSRGAMASGSVPFILFYCHFCVPSRLTKNTFNQSSVYQNLLLTRGKFAIIITTLFRTF